MSVQDVPESDPSTQPVPTLSFGQKAVGLSFNPGGSVENKRFKEIMAVAIDELNDLRDRTTSPEVKRMCSTSITYLQTGQMWGTKAITWQD